MACIRSDELLDQVPSDKPGAARYQDLHRQQVYSARLIIPCIKSKRDTMSASYTEARMDARSPTKESLEWNEKKRPIFRRSC
jgi:hypothetical protein